MKVVVGFICIAIIMVSAILFMRGVEQHNDEEN